jgi:hypothetical protein
MGASEKEHIINRASELRAQGLPWSAVASTLTAEGLMDSTGKPFTGESTRKFLFRHKQDTLDKGGQVGVAANRDKVDTVEAEPVHETVTKEEVSNMLQQTEARLSALIDSKIKAAFGEGGSVVSAGKRDDPPRPPKEGKRFTGKKEDIRARIDSELFKRLNEDCEHYGGNMSTCLDAILWRYYEKPRLSFEKPQISDSEPSLETDT